MKLRDDDPRCLGALDRRAFLKTCRPLALALVARGMFPPALRAAPSSVDADAGDEVIDEALTILQGYGPEYGGGLSNHAPMAAEALVALRRPEALRNSSLGAFLDLSRKPLNSSAQTTCTHAVLLADSNTVMDSGYEKKYTT